MDDLVKYLAMLQWWRFVEMWHRQRTEDERSFAFGCRRRREHARGGRVTRTDEGLVKCKTARNVQNIQVGSDSQKIVVVKIYVVKNRRNYMVWFTIPTIVEQS